MNKNWKKRLSIFLKDSFTYTTLPIAIFGLGAFASIITNIIFTFLLDFSMLSTTLWTFGASAFGLIGICLVEALFFKNDGYDEQIKKEEEMKLKQEKQRKQEEIKKKELEEMEKKRKRLEALTSLTDVVEELPYCEEEKHLLKALVNMIKTLQHILNTYDVSVEEEHYLFHKLPNYMKEIIFSYEKLLEENKKVKSEEILQLLHAKQQELETLFIQNHQENIMMEMNKNMKMLDRNVYQNLYEQS